VTRRRVVAGLALSGTLLLTGCDGVAGMQLPGGAATGRDVYRVTVEFADVLDLVPQSAVKVNDVTVGSVEKVWLSGFTAKVRVRVKDSVVLPDNAIAELRQTSLLGEKFVSLAPPPGAQPVGRLGDADVIPVARSGRNPEVEEVFSALSLLLNGGGVAQLRTINVELAEAMKGRESDIQSAIRQLDTFIGGLDDRKADVLRAIDGLDKLSARLAAQKQDIIVALEDIPAGLRVLADQRRALTAMLRSLARLGTVGTRVIKASKADTVANLEALTPILARLQQAGEDLPHALEMVLTYPFPRTTLKAVRGDYTNLRADLDASTLLALLDGLPGGPPAPRPTPTLPPLPVPTPTLPPLPTPSVSVPPLPTRPPAPPPTCIPILCPGPDGRPVAFDLDLAMLMTGGYTA
jgi:phospholipid/cholesterol/gamma-HCH transport system substrate-binding protein